MSNAAQVQPSDSHGGTLGLTVLGALGDHATARVRKAIGTYAVAHAAYRIGKRWWDKAQAETTFTVAVPESDAIYPDIHAWLLARMPADKRRALTARSGSSRSDVPVSVDDAPRPAGITLFYDGTKSQTVDLDGHKVKVSLEAPDWSALSMNVDLVRSKMQDRVVFSVRSIEGRDAVVAFLAEVQVQHAKQPPRFWVADRWGSWNTVRDVPPRTLGSVVLAKGQREALVVDLTEFLSREDDYARLGIPWHHGVLLHGPPGGGKSSIAKALANHLGLDVHYVALSVIEDDSRLTKLFSQVSPRSILVIEDIDIVHGAKSRNDEAKGVTLGGLLNVLDGFLSPHGTVTMMTTNNLAVLDPALVRPGRVDLRMEIGYLDDDQLARLVETFCGPSAPLPAIAGTLTPASVVDVLKRHLDTPADALPEIARLCTDA